jgi:hypothetical protein
MKSALAEALELIAEDAREDRARRRPSNIPLLIAAALVVASFITGNHLVSTSIGLAAVTAGFAGIYVLVAPKGLARVISLTFAAIGIIGAAAGIAVLASGGLVPEIIGRGLNCSVALSMLTLFVFIVKTRLLDTRPGSPVAVAE